MPGENQKCEIGCGQLRRDCPDECRQTVAPGLFLRAQPDRILDEREEIVAHLRHGRLRAGLGGLGYIENTTERPRPSGDLGAIAGRDADEAGDDRDGQRLGECGDDLDVGQAILRQQRPARFGDHRFERRHRGRRQRLDQFLPQRLMLDGIGEQQPIANRIGNARINAFRIRFSRLSSPRGQGACRIGECAHNSIEA
jgi:hypothetical protein